MLAMKRLAAGFSPQPSTRRPIVAMLIVLVSIASVAADEPVMELGPVIRVATGPAGHYGFPRLVRAADDRLLLFYRVGNEHAAGDAEIGLRDSTDNGQTWSDERTVWRAPTGTAAHNPVALVTRSGEVILWISRYVYRHRGHERQPCLWCRSKDNGQTWSEPELFDRDTNRSCYYITDAIQTSDGLLAADAAFPPAGAGSCYVQAWRSTDDGRTWSVLSQLTKREENFGDEVGLLETEPGVILCLLRHRQKSHPEFDTTWRLWSRDGGRTWSPREDMSASLGVLQRPFLTRLDERTILVTGRSKPKRTVAYLSRDNGQTFGERFVLDAYQAEGGYTAVVPLDAHRVVIAWHSDEGVKSGRPDIKVATLSIR